MAAQAHTAGGNVTAVHDKRQESSVHRTASENIHAITESTRHVFAASERLAKDLEELSTRLAQGAEFRTHIAKQPWLVAALTLAGAVVIWNAFNRRN
jgi:hypothetical protein